MNRHPTERETRFVADAAHELRTPVAHVVGLIETLAARRGKLPEAEVAKLELALLQQGRRLGTLVDQLLDLSRLDAGVVPIRPRPVRVRRKIEELVTAAGADRVVSIDVADDLEAHIDVATLERILTNLLQNALRYGATPIIVAAHAEGGRLRLTVEDRGPGVPEPFVPRLFERFTRSDASRAMAPDGSGLGLPIALAYARAHRGELVYEAAEPSGARFTLRLPLAEAGAELTRAANGHHARL